MALNADRIRALAEDESADLPPISAAQALATVRLMSTEAPGPGVAPIIGPAH